MLYLFHGEPFWIQEKLLELEKRATEKNYEVFKIRDDSQVPLNSFLSRDLFGKKTFLILDNVLEIPERGEEVKKLAEDFSRSENIIAVVEEDISESSAKAFEKAGANIKEFKKPSAAKFLAWLSVKAKAAGLNLSKQDTDILILETGSNPFAILNKLERLSLESRLPARLPKAVGGNYFNFADAVFGKRKNQAISMLRSYIRDGLGAEEAFWKLRWKIKTLRLVDSGKKTTNLHPFVQKKAIQDLQNFSSRELKKISQDLLDIFSEVRRGEDNFEDGLERLIIKL
ncbi:hypothetical protein A3I27_01020 [Candidatus Giovannonibacteria bacterium RIFCSPLOWO2_02_FULL_43_11b]|uniref:DNA-directed DNA polymerase n=1 Tax=Candidatus Giovannonibacteria bacterium RIFCSPHIGHO2_12_FULL_43_15 TaxID=1798341 RepID=A0A1F5WPJ3_9BACT|nr:MAG: hypothetical protein A2739_01225 [Candidatus Giovannonibacteria bacterium RIFCSPHIGHO2_01_FULL_43_100]OGF66764.1 MAG: hypothetical protein A3B97_02525 [Candidatus Giovannonibacteria bacterium RIFCSPHIGHO2_02_FULL_43_32]OGF77540.1 MAG: hypothetical protein A3F23_01020 [Candidatus Giovannonibacteria bacterium RIFCSPHIGHO2_12_FULL_43_15]OGF79001.1 MAG: hypothetical protein A3A15_00645 [Candidatus Giovannonibacteria bacterium RIFCSPLOWO2_01_FULL_43_60]OGF90385.1 MAG: hypothetical protein A3